MAQPDDTFYFDTEFTSRTPKGASVVRFVLGRCRREAGSRGPLGTEGWPETQAGLGMWADRRVGLWLFVPILFGLTLPPQGSVGSLYLGEGVGGWVVKATVEKSGSLPRASSSPLGRPNTGGSHSRQG